MMPSHAGLTRIVMTMAFVALTATNVASAADIAPAPAPAPASQDKPDVAAPRPGEALFAQDCASCHLGQVARAPHKMFLEMMPADMIFAALDAGVMRSHAEKLTSAQKHQVADFLNSDKPPASPPAPRCTGQAAYFDTRRSPAASGWGITPDNRRYIDAQTAGLAASDLPQLELKWAFAFPGAQRARSQPAAAYGAIYVGSQDGTVYALDVATGCVRWTYRASAEVRTAIVVESVDAARARNGTPRVYFGDLIARVYALDAFTGALVWMHKADDHPNATVTAAPALHEDALYVSVSSLEVTSAADPAYECCTFRGSVLALNATTGAVKWKTYTMPQAPAFVGKTRVGTRIFGPSGAPVWNTPALDIKRGMLYVGTGENYSSPANDRSDAQLALRMRDGELVWHAQRTAGDAWNVACMIADNPNCPQEDGPDFDFGSSAILLDRGNADPLLLAGQKSGDVYGIDPAQDGRVVWRTKVGRGGIQGGVHFGMATDGERLYVPISDMKDEGTGEVYKEPSRAGLYALDPASGKLLWSAPADDKCAGRKFCDAGISAAITAMHGAVLAGHMDGRLRAYESATGRVLWEVDTTRMWATVSGATAQGGSFGGGAGPMVVGGNLIAVSGYGIYAHMPGNVLLVFGKK
jgi:polyvinyl alcohol dehydrogenase (cytochrome)